MTDSAPHQSIRILTSLKEVSPAEWDALSQGPRDAEKSHAVNGLNGRADSECEPVPPSGPAGTNLARTAPEPFESDSEEVDSFSQPPESAGEEDTGNPFISHAFLSALEDSGSVGGRSGWSPLHLLTQDENGTAIGAMPVYAKSHSRGEYVFDHAFADAYNRAGLAYYPKLQISVPFTPATARKFLIAPGADERNARTTLLGGLAALRLRLGASSVHATFLTAQDRETFARAGYLLRVDQQFHFTNPGYAGFEDFLGELASRKRKVLRRERRAALENGITVEWATGKDLTEAHWDAFFAFYRETGSRKWGSPYLTRAFFSLIGERMADRILLVMARRGGRYVAGALNLIGANTLYGRNWGAIEHHPFLHFELCYYQAIDFAIAHGLARVEAGAQGEHKLARGYRPVKTFSAHRFADERFQRAVADYLDHEREEIALIEAELSGQTPFRRPANTG